MSRDGLSRLSMRVEESGGISELSGLSRKVEEMVSGSVWNVYCLSRCDIFLFLCVPFGSFLMGLV